MEEFIKKSVRLHSRQVEETLTPDEILQKQKSIQRPCLEPEELMYRKRWMAGDLNPKEVSHEMEMSLECAQKLLQNVASIHKKG